MKKDYELLKKIGSYSAIAAALLPMQKHADAQVVYHDFIPDLSAGYYDLDLNNDGIVDFHFYSTFEEYGSNCCGSVENEAHIEPLGYNEVVITPFLDINPLSQGVTIDENDNWGIGGELAGDRFEWCSCAASSGTTWYSGVWSGVLDKFLGIEFRDAANAVHYGWIRLSNVYYSNMVIKDYAYNATPGASIVTGSGIDCSTFNVVITNAADTISACAGNTVQLTASTSLTGSSYHLQWYRNDTLAYGWNNWLTTLTTAIPGNYYAVFGDLICSDTSQTVTVLIQPNPPPPLITFSNDTLFSSGTGSFQWKLNGSVIPGATDNYHVPSTYGNYTVVVTTAVGCSALSAAYPYLNCATFTASLLNGSEVNFCKTYPGSNYSFYLPNNSGYFYQWLKNGNSVAGATSSSYHATESGYYQVVMSTAQCIDTSNTVEVDAITPPGQPYVYLSGDTLKSNVTEGNLNWFRSNSLINGATQNFYVPSIFDDYELLVTDAYGCNTKSAPLYPCTLLNALIINSDPFVQCSNSTNTHLSLSPSTSSTYNWFLNDSIIPNAHGNTYIPVITGDYSAIVTSYGCIDTTDAITVIYDQVPIAPPVEQQGDTLLSAYADSYQWYYRYPLNSLWYLLAGAVDSFYIPDSTKNFYSFQVRTQDSLGCTLTSEIVYENCTYFNHQIAMNDVCSGTAHLYTIPYQYNNYYNWFKDDSILLEQGFYNNLNISTTGIYSVNISQLGCTDSISEAVVIQPALQISLQGDTLFSNYGTGNQWFYNNFIAPVSTDSFCILNQYGLYTLDVYDPVDSCTASKHFYYQNCSNVVSLITNGTSDTICPGSSVTLHSLYCDYCEYDWYKDSTFLGFGNYIYANQSENYFLITSSGNCTDTSGIFTLHIDSLQPPILIQMGDTLIAQSDYHWSSYRWFACLADSNSCGSYNYSTTDSIVPLYGAYYRVEFLDSMGCYSPWSNTILYNDCNTFTDHHEIHGDTTICEGYNLSLNVDYSAYSNVEWFHNNVQVSSSLSSYYLASNVIANNSGNYFAVVHDNMGCIDTTPTVHVYIYPKPTPVIAATNGDILASSYSYGNQWYLSGGNSVYSYDSVYIPVQFGSYYVKVTDSMGCYGYSPNYYFLDCNLDTAFIFADDGITDICVLNPLELESNISGNDQLYSWYRDSVMVAIGNMNYELNVTAPGNYFLIKSNFYNCNDTSNTIEVTGLQVPQIILMGDTLVCTTVANSYQWKKNGVIINGATNYFYIPLTNGNYQVVITDSAGCFDQSNSFPFVITATASEATPLNVVYSFNRDLFVQINSPLYNGYEICMYNTLGEKVLTKEINSAQTIISLKNYSSGIYEVQLSKGSSYRFYKILLP